MKPKFYFMEPIELMGWMTVEDGWKKELESRVGAMAAHLRRARLT
jgi:hypothetical protein